MAMSRKSSKLSVGRKLTLGSCSGTQSDSIAPHRNIVVLGDARVGKSSIINVFCDGQYKTNWKEYYRNILVVNDSSYEISIHDLAAGQYYLGFRQDLITISDVVLLCYDINEVKSLESAQRFWMSEIRRLRPHVPVILVGNKLDTREQVALEVDTERRRSSTSQGEKIAAQMGACAYIECSAKDDMITISQYDPVRQVLAIFVEWHWDITFVPHFDLCFDLPENELVLIVKISLYFISILEQH